MRTARVSAIVSAAQLACLLEVGAPKPGNVSPLRAFADASYHDFVVSAIAIGEPFSRVADQPLGRTIRQAIDATRRWTSVNTNLGIVLLLAPLARAAAARPGDQAGTSGLRRAVRNVLGDTTVADARDVYAAIRTAAHGGLGDAPAQDIRNEPDITLLEAMRLAAHRDTIAREYATGFETTFTRGVPALQRARTDGLDWNGAIVEAFLELLAAVPDTHIARRAGDGDAEDVSARAREVCTAGGVRTASGRDAIVAFDAWLRDPANLRNPGTTADLTAAALFVVLLDGGWRT